MNAKHPPAQSPVAQAPVHRAQQLLLSLAEDRADLMAMNQLLDRERAILDNGEHAMLEQTAQQKIQLAAQMELRHKRREQLLPKLPATESNDAKNWRARLALLEKQSGIGLLHGWQEIETLLAESAGKLRINEKIVASLQGNVNRFINALRAQAGDGQTYNAAGKAKTLSSGLPLGSA
ncbi:MAG: flagellar protein FlgN [Pseudomonadales bacterium]